jgi:hypothetical protein
VGAAAGTDMLVLTSLINLVCHYGSAFYPCAACGVAVADASAPR